MLPTFIVIGAMKSGTTSLLHYLGLHPSVSVSSPKELNFFMERGRWARGVEWYASRFGDSPARGEASTGYTKYPSHAGVPERMHSVIPRARLIYLIREPVSRIESHLHHKVVDGSETRSPREIFSDLDNHFVHCSMYWMQLSRYLEVYPPEQLLVLRSDRLRQDRMGVLRRACRFIGADPDRIPRELPSELHSSADKVRRNALGRAIARALPLRAMRHRAPGPLVRLYRFLATRRPSRPRLPDDVRRRIRLHLRDDIDEMAGFMGTDLSAWYSMDED